MAKKKPLSGLRRVLRGDLEKELRERDELARLDEGGTPERAIALPSPSLVELRASSYPCHRCGGELTIAEHTILALAGGETRRKVRASCKSCGSARVLFFRIDTPLIN